MTDQKIVSRIRALLAKAADEACSEDEAMAAAARAQRMLEEHNLTMADVAPEERDPHVTVTFDPRYADPWRRSIVFAVARVYGCRAVNTEISYTTTSRKTGRPKLSFRRAFMFAGRPHAVTICESMCTYLFDTTVRLARSYSSVRSDQTSFERGCGERLASRLQALAEERKRTVRTSSPATHALVVQEDRLVDEYCERTQFVTGRMRVVGSSLDGAGARDGWEAGGAVSLEPQVPAAGAAGFMIGRS